MKIERSIVASRRATGEACTVISDFVAGIARGREYPDLAGIREAFARLSPMFSVMLVSRSLAEPAISVRMPDLQAEVTVSYDPGDDDNLTIPDMGLLDKLTGSAPIEIVLHAKGTPHARQYERVAEASGDRVKFTLAAGTSPVPDTVPDTIPGPAPIPVPSPDPVPASDMDPDLYLGLQADDVPDDLVPGNNPFVNDHPTTTDAENPADEDSFRFRYSEADGAADGSDDASQPHGSGYPETESGGYPEGQDFLGQPADYE